MKRKYRINEEQQQRTNAILAMYFENHTLKEVGQKFGITHQAVQQAVKKAGYSSHQAPTRETLTNNRPNRFTTKERLLNQTDVRGNDDCWRWMGYIYPSSGYGKLRVAKLNEEYVHRVSYIVHHRKKIQGNILHSCDNRFCVNPKHLRDDTLQENVKDRQKRRYDYWHKQLIEGRGTIAPMTKFWGKDVRLMQQRRLNGESYDAIAKDFNTNYATVSRILNGKVQAYQEILQEHFAPT